MFTRDALLLIGHGSSVLPDAARPLIAHADAIRATGRFGEVAAGMLLGEPNAAAVFSQLTSPVVHVVPFFLDDGYFTRIVIPDLLLPLASGSRVVSLCQAVGANDGIAGVLASRVVQYCDMFGIDPKLLSLLLVGHGSAKNPGRARTMRRHATALEHDGRFGWVRIAYLEEAPLVTEALAGSRGHVVAVIGYLLNDGVHATSDLPKIIAAERMKRGTHWPPVHDLGILGSDPAMSRLLMEQVVTPT